MQRVSVRDFQLKPTKFLKELPIVLTQYNKDVAKIVPMTENVLTDEPEKPETGWRRTCEAPNQNCKLFGKKYLIVLESEEGEHRIENYLCPTHLAVVQRQGARIEEL